MTAAKFGYRDRIIKNRQKLPNYRDRSFEITETDYQAHMLATVPTFDDMFMSALQLVQTTDMLHSTQIMTVGKFETLNTAVPQTAYS